MFENLGSAMPSEIDSEIGRLSADVARLRAMTDSCLDRMHGLVGDVRELIPRSRRRGSWKLTIAQTIESARNHPRCVQYLDRYEAHCLEIAELNGAIAILSAEYLRRPWSRFFEVVSSNGHIHRSMSCSTCRPTTGFAWHPELAGQTEKSAVEACGPFLCSVCFPSAPVAWTRERADVKAEQDARSGIYCPGVSYREGTRRRRYPSGIGECIECGTYQVLTSTGKVRKHRKVAG